MKLKPFSLLDLPPEVVFIILENLSDKDIFTLGSVCQQLYEIKSSYIQLGN